MPVLCQGLATFGRYNKREFGVAIYRVAKTEYGKPWPRGVTRGPGGAVRRITTRRPCTNMSVGASAGICSGIRTADARSGTSLRSAFAQRRTGSRRKTNEGVRTYLSLISARIAVLRDEILTDALRRKFACQSEANSVA